MNKLTPFLSLGVLALASCEEEPSSSSNEKDHHQEELQHWQSRAEEELQKRQVIESENLNNISLLETMEKAVLATGVAAVASLFLGGAMGSKAKNDVLDNS